MEVPALNRVSPSTLSPRDSGNPVKEEAEGVVETQGTGDT